VKQKTKIYFLLYFFLVVIIAITTDVGNALSLCGICCAVVGSGPRFNFGVFLIFSGLIFFIGAFGIAFNRKNVLLLMASLEIMFLGINLVFISGYIFLNLEVGLVYALITLSVSAAEAAVGFGLLMASFRNQPDVTFSDLNKLKG